ncbi:alpha/beta fold hydrolase [Bacteroidetes bacterium endosymbiont of Geopemphigus sp.]|nr:alpha/beta fold hydrolase [Bacteroidetes bacterium endosymbiont of Geopemphigus sp.]
MHSKIYGKGQPLLILHGLFGMGDNWTTLGKKWAGDHQEVHLLDLRNHGKSFHSGAMSYDLLSEDLLNYMERHGLSKPVLLGHSMGGKAAMHFSLHYPENARALVVADIAPRSYPAHHQKIITSIKHVPINTLKSRGALNEFLQENIDDPAIRELLSKNSYRTEEDHFAFRFYLPGIENNYEGLISAQSTEKTYHGKALFLCGDESDYIVREDFSEIQKIFPGSEIITIPKAGHWIHLDNPQAVYEKVDRFLKAYQE